MTNDQLIAPELPEQLDPSVVNKPSGWYEVLSSDQLESKKAVQIEDFPTQLVAWRGEGNKVCALDLYCKHMGAALSCGEVDGNSIRCPFHAWSWNKNGDCDDIPYAKKIPDKAKIRSWATDEKDGLIYVWFDRNGKKPDPEGSRFNK